MTDGLLFDYAHGPLGAFGKFTVSLEVEGERFPLESAYSNAGIRSLTTKWKRYGQQVNLTTTMTDAARRAMTQARGEAS
jgi:hypothetical protein